MNAKKRAGVCLACSYSCHEGHEMVELYTKRTFRCDCGTAKILAVRCRLDEVKLDQNDKNQYNQNFSGLYCVCHRPYPDPEDPIDDEMIQCIVCEDWYHCRHLDTLVPNMNEFTEMVCGGCMDLHPFLHNYDKFTVKADVETSSADLTIVDVAEQPSAEVADVVTADIADEPADDVVDLPTAEVADVPSIDMGDKPSVDVADEASVDMAEEPSGDLSIAASTTEQLETVDKAEEQLDAADKPPADEQLTDEINQCIMDIIEINKSNGENNETDGQASETDVEPAPKRQKLDIAGDIRMTTCKKPMAPTVKKTGATFWPHDWRLSLCDCYQCKTIMQKEHVEFLFDLEDTVLAYQEKGMAKVRDTEYNRDIRALSGMNRVQQINAITGYNKLKERLADFLKTFVTSKQVVTEDDINRFFRMMNNEKGNQNDGDGGGAAF